MKSSIITTIALSILAGTCFAAEYTTDEHTWALYHFNNDYLDSSGNNRNLTVENPFGYIGFADSISSDFGSALYLSQRHTGWSDQSRIYSPELRYPGSGSWTVESLIYVPQASEGATVISHYSEHVAGHDPYQLYYQGSDNTASWKLNNSVTSQGLMSRDSWHHIAGVYDDASGTMKLYIDKILVDEQLSAAPENLQDYNVYIGGTWFGIEGQIYLDELRISDIARTPAEFIPEPATVLLFSLGALVLRKKHR